LAILGIFFGLYSFWLPIEPQSPLNLVFSTYANHNHLGNFLALVAVWGVATLTLTQARIAPLFLVVFALPLVFFSYARSSYLGVIAASLLLFFQVPKTRRILPFLALTVLILATLSFWALTTAETKQFFPNAPQLVFKDWLNGRESFWLQALSSIKALPLWGVGLGNFILISARFSTVPYHWSSSSENLFLNVATEGGLVAGLIFFIWIIVILKKANKKLPLFYVWVTLLTIFQTIYLFNMPALLSLFFILAGLVGPAKEERPFPSAWLKLVLGGLLGFVVILNQHYFFLSVGSFKLAKLVYPFNPYSHRRLILENLLDNNRLEARRLAEEYCQRFGAKVEAQTECAALFLNFGQKKQALAAYEQAYLWHPYEAQLYQRIYYLKKELTNKTSAEKALEGHRQKLQQIPKTAWQKGGLFEEYERFLKRK
jgi:hypothetical protein